MFTHPSLRKKQVVVTWRKDVSWLLQLGILCTREVDGKETCSSRGEGRFLELFIDFVVTHVAPSRSAFRAQQTIVPDTSEVD